jgi:DNA-binding Xre family transcriptional regulator
MQQGIGPNDASMHYILQAEFENAGMHRRTREILKQLMADHHIASERQLALDCNMSQSTLHRFIKGETETLEFHHLQSLAHHFSLTVSQLIGETSFSTDPKIRVVTFAMEHMPEYKKDVLVAASSTLAQPDANGNGATAGQ